MVHYLIFVARTAEQLVMKRSINLQFGGASYAHPIASAQLWKMKRYEATAGLGTSQFYGDVGGYSIGENAWGLKDITFKQTRFNVNGSFRYFFTDEIAARLSSVIRYASCH